MNNFYKILLLILTILSIIIYFQNLSLKKEIKDLKIIINEMKTFERPAFSGNEPIEKKIIYIGNSKTLKFHLPDCQWAKRISLVNKTYFPSREKALENGYQPCKLCNP
ncbi:MAG: hypothetical protein N2323_05830 [candidate division WOR-3 bacterium]|nr:hypothetical protein [candidate division WOR-3 bacterium]